MPPAKAKLFQINLLDLLTLIHEYEDIGSGEYEKQVQSIIEYMLKTYYPKQWNKMKHMDMLDISGKMEMDRAELIWFVSAKPDEEKRIIPADVTYDDYGHPPVEFLKEKGYKYFKLPGPMCVGWHLSDKEFEFILKNDRVPTPDEP